MAILRLSSARPAANTAVGLRTFTDTHLVSVIATNTSPSTTPIPKVTIYVSPFGADSEGSFIYIASNVTLNYGTSFETFRFAVNPQDTVFVRATTQDVSFSLYGLLQDDAVGQGDLPQTFTNKVIRGTNNTIYIDRGATAERRGDEEEGYVRYNDDFETVEVRTSSTWEQLPKGDSQVVEVQPTVSETAYVGLYESNLGVLKGKTSLGLTYNAATQTLTAANVEAQDVSVLTGLSVSDITATGSLTLDPPNEVLSTAPLVLASKTVSDLNSLPATAGAVVYCSNDTGGPTLAFYDGVNWRRVSDNQVVQV